ncbi:molybdate ABC transporter permease subunit [Planktothrix sp. FACHB-1355]|uniref:Molybdate ABC transporter permease subunit n=1 Tax=Aerosakkonema funiforme FACHB-1375 TaxID=2949571 RepID=A0A926VMP0_9CYAN|nr:MULTISPECIES: molybdate ABC transporter permease subunit [Oscillatoriales]MBD2185667.1 molybdate ABC transporter permease subunit [Aerosakkonema funiforme FACHB-1375]MBD3557712.1 molybdate ABC transporter permease subunit [Planktothrix sp. FACHB-1355]
MTADLSPLWISLKTAGLATIAIFFTGIAAAYWMLGYRGRWKSVIEGIFVSPLILPPTVVGFILLLLFGKNGPLGHLTAQFDFTVVFSWYAAVITATVVGFPLMYKTALGAFEQVDRSLLQVAQTLGASKARIFWRVLLPLSVPGILAGTMLGFARALGEFGATLMLAGNIPGQTQTIPMAIYFAVEAGAINEAWLWVIAIMTISLSGIVAVNLWQKQYERKIQGKFGVVEANEPVNGRHRKTELAQIVPLARPQLHQFEEGLLVDIEKQLANFTLKTTFTAQEETLGLLGGSGSGKSMTLRCIAGVETPTEGRIVLNGQTLFDSEKRIDVPSHQRKVSLVFQNYALFPHMTVAQNIAFGLQRLPKRLRSQRVNQHLALLQLQGLGDRYPHQLSGGQQQRVALARALATEPEALLLDEPFSALDTYLRSQVERQLIETLSTYSGVTLFVTHNLEEAYRVCEKLMVMSGGKPIAFDAKHQIFEHPRTIRVAQLTGCKNFSRATALGVDKIEAIDWGVTLQVVEAIPDDLADVGIRAHQISLMPNADSNLNNTFPCWLASTSETPHRMTLFLKLNAAPENAQDYHVQAEIFKEKWEAIKNHPFPWYARFDPLRLILMVD